MTDDRKAGIALIAGSLGGILTMAVHPSGMVAQTADQVAHMSIVTGAVHSLGLVSALFLFLGACGLTRRIGDSDRISFAALVTYGFGCVAIMIAGGVSGFTFPEIMKHMVRDDPAVVHQWRIVIDGIFQINQAFARIYSVAASIAIILWSVSALLHGGFARGFAIYGCFVAPLIILGIGIGHLRLDVHGMAVVMLGQAIWFVLVGSQMCARSSSA